MPKWLWKIEDDANKIPAGQLSLQDEDIERLLDTFYQRAQYKAGQTVQWYVQRKNTVATFSRALRGFAIVFIVMGGLAPIAKATFSNIPARFGAVDIAQLGYFFLAFAGGCLAIDRFIGCSTAWIRYIETACSIEREREEFSYNWIRIVAKYRGQALSAETINELLALCSSFNDTFTRLINSEVAAWRSECQITHSELHKLQGKSSSTTPHPCPP